MAKYGRFRTTDSAAATIILYGYSGPGWSDVRHVSKKAIGTGTKITAKLGSMPLFSHPVRSPYRSYLPDESTYGGILCYYK